MTARGWALSPSLPFASVRVSETAVALTDASGTAHTWAPHPACPCAIRHTARLSAINHLMGAANRDRDRRSGGAAP